MALKTKFSDEELIHILSHYELGEFIHSEPCAGGTVQTNIVLYTTKGRYVFRYYENRKEGSVLFEVSLLSYLKDQQYPCPAPICKKDGGYIGVHQLKSFVLFEFMDGQHISNPTMNQRKQLIQKAAELHNLTQHYVPVNREDRLNYSMDLCRDLAHQASHRINTTEATEKFSWLEKELLQLQLPQSLPSGICHADFHFSNVLYLNDEFHALLDFDDANHTYLLYDLVGLIESSAWRHDHDNILDFAKARQVLSEYSKYRALHSLEEMHLFDVYKLSILMDCVWYFDRGHVQDFYEKRKIDFINAIGREQFNHQLFGSLSSH
ncbi:homoserine kinase [Paenibacillus sp. OV219]|uniref:homoserine kinase n=1 Tax=Paenibacillus sp. OV219 TaxID=1884377 RepID=UPI0008C160FA|nr:homoserine kinase [Paenibacillus sp. OV219]SEN96405.1 homoserine kinase [Paenibacillus sp. OV219]